MKKLLFLSTYKSPSVLRDYEILKKHFKTKTLFFPNIKKKPFDILKTIIIILINVYKNDYIFVRFGDFRAYLVVLFSKIFKKRNAVVIGGYEVTHEPQFHYGGLSSKGRKNRIRYILKNSEIIIANSEFSKKEINDLDPNVRVEVINHGIEKTEKISHKRNLIVTIGNCYEYKHKLKGIDTFVKATKDLNISPIIIGDYEQKVYNELKSINPSIVMTGFLHHDKVMEMLKSAKVYCQLSYRESFGVALLEAMSVGCIPVVTNRAALTEVVGDYGFYTKFGDVDNTVEKIKNALSSNISEKVVDRVSTNFTLKQREKKILELMREKNWI